MHARQSTEYFILQMVGNIGTVKETISQCLHTGKDHVLDRLTEQRLAMLMYTLKFMTLKQRGTASISSILACNTVFTVTLLQIPMARHVHSHVQQCFRGSQHSLRLRMSWCLSVQLSHI